MRLRELYETIQLDENYNGKVTKLKNSPVFAQHPDLLQDFDARLEWAKQVFSDKNQPMLWYITLYESWLLQEQDPNAKAKYETMLGGYPPFDFAAFEGKLDHWLSSAYAERNQIKDVVKKINSQTTTVDALIKNLEAAEAVITKEDETKVKKATPVEILEGDHIILPLGNQGDWWLLPTNKHTAESKVMGHCGTAHHTSNVLLSLRDKVPIPWVTMEYNPHKKELHQMKGRSNSKPATKFHHAILALLKSDLVDGFFAGQTYQASSDFSIFDMNPAMVEDIAATKPNLLITQIKKYPIDFLRAPQSVRANPDYRNFAISLLPGIAIIVDEEGVTSTDNNTWENAINQDPNMIIYSPNTLKDWENRVANRLIKEHNLISYAPNNVRINYNIMSRVIKEGNPAVIELIPFRAPRYKDLALLAIDKRSTLIKAINTEGWSTEEIKAAWIAAASEYLGTKDWPADLFTPEDEQPIWRSVIKKQVWRIKDMPAGVFDEDDELELWMDAIKRDSYLATTEAFNNSKVPAYAKRKLQIDTLEEHPEAIEYYDDDLITDRKKLLDVWTRAIARAPQLIHNPKFPSQIFDRDDVRDLWYAMSLGPINYQVNLKNIPTDILTPKEVQTVIKNVLQTSPQKILTLPYELTDKKTRLDALYSTAEEDSWSFLNDTTENPLPPEIFSDEEIKNFWEGVLKVNEEDNGGHAYLITCKYIPYHLLDHDIVFNKWVYSIDTDYAENDSVLRRANYNVLEKYFSQEELHELHEHAVTNTQCNGENSGPFAAVPKKYRTFDLAKIALNADSGSAYTVVVASRDLYTDEEFAELTAFAGEYANNVDQGMVAEIQDYDQINYQYSKPDPFEGQ